MAHEVYSELYTGLSLADFVLQAALAGELLLCIVPPGRRLVTGGTALLIAAGMTGLSVALLPQRSPVPADRATIFTGLLFISLCGIAARVRLHRWVRSVVMGFAVMGLSGALSAWGKSVAASYRDSHAYVAWSYGNAMVYLAVLIYWIVVSLQRGKEAGPARKTASEFMRGTI